MFREIKEVLVKNDFIIVVKFKNGKINSRDWRI